MPAITESRYLVTAGWDDVPHLTETTKRELLESTPPYLRDARAKGIPSLGAGAIYPIAVEEISCEPFQIPEWWPRAYALDVGWNKTAALWQAWDPESDIGYLYSEYYRGQAEPVIHSSAIKARGEWIRGVIDPAGRNRAQRDGERLMSEYQALGLHLTPANNAVEAGLHGVWQQLSLGRLKAFSTLTNFFAEYRIYRREEKETDTGTRTVVVKKFDHLMDCMRYLHNSGRAVARVRPVGKDPVVRHTVLDQRSAY